MACRMLYYLTVFEDHRHILHSIADYFALASAAKFAEGRGATTSLVLKHLASSRNFQAEASEK